MGCSKLYEGWFFLRGGEKHLLFPRKPREKNRSRSAPAEMDDESPFLFSSEYLDSETGLVYYNYRYYSPELGRWINRDPIAESGGANLYHFVFNNPYFYIDLFGLEIWYLLEKEYRDECAKRMRPGDEQAVDKYTEDIKRTINQHNASIKQTKQPDLHLTGSIVSSL